MFMVGILMTTATFAGLMMMTAALTAILSVYSLGRRSAGRSVGMAICSPVAFLVTGGNLRRPKSACWRPPADGVPDHLGRLHDRHQARCGTAACQIIATPRSGRATA
jgi:hypothetical protein